MSKQDNMTTQERLREDFYEWAKVHHNATPTETQKKVVDAVLSGEELTIMLPRKYGVTYFNKLTKEYIEQRTTLRGEK